MKTHELLKIVDQYVSLLNNAQYFDSGKVSGILKEAMALKSDYQTLVVSEDMAHIYEALCGKGSKVIDDIKKNRQDTKGNLQRAKVFLRYLHAAKADFKGISSKAVGRYFLIYMLSSILFLALSPQYFGYILPAIMFVPIYLGIKGVKNRAFSGFMMSLSVVPMGLMTATYWIQYGLAAMDNMNGAVEAVIKSAGVSINVATALVVVPSVMAVVLAVAAALQLYMGLKIRTYFV